MALARHSDVRRHSGIVSNGLGALRTRLAPPQLLGPTPPAREHLALLPPVEFRPGFTIFREAWPRVDSRRDVTADSSRYSIAVRKSPMN
jgi:hypothetical protein